MRGSAIRSLKSARHAPIIAAALFERNVQIWNWDTGERGCEFEMVTDGHSHLSLSPYGDYLLAANWRKGEPEFASLHVEGQFLKWRMIANAQRQVPAGHMAV